MLKALTVLFVFWQSGFYQAHSLTLGLESAISKHMKTHRWFTRNRFVPHLRIASVVTLMSAAAAMAFVAVNPSSPLFLAKSDSKSAIDKLRQNRAALFRNKLAIPGPEQEGGPTAAAEEAYAIRAAGAAYVPFTLT